MEKGTPGVAALARDGDRAYVQGMSGPPDNHELALKVAKMEGDMSALNSEVKASLEANNAAFERLRADMANQKVWLFALVFGAVVTGITLGLALSG